MPFQWKPSPQLPKPVPPIVIPEEATTFKVHVVANTVNSGGTLLYNTAAISYDVIYEIPTLNVGRLVTRSINTSFANITAGTINTAPVGPFDLVNKQYVDSFGGGGGGSGTQNVFVTINVAGQTNVVADSSTDTLTLIGGRGITLTTNATNDSITITSNPLTINAKGDLIVGLAPNVHTLLPVGLNQALLTANNRKTEGMFWNASKALVSYDTAKAGASQWSFKEDPSWQSSTVNFIANQSGHDLVAWSPELGIWVGLAAIDFSQYPATSQSLHMVISRDGINWDTFPNPTSPNGHKALIWVSELSSFFALSGRIVFSSSDGYNWSTIGTIPEVQSGGSENYLDMLWCPDRQELFAVGEFFTFSPFNRYPISAFSSTGQSWTSQAADLPLAHHNSFIRVEWSPQLNLYCAVMSANSTAPQSSIAYSSNGRSGWAYANTSNTSAQDIAQSRGFVWSQELGIFCLLQEHLDPGIDTLLVQGVITSSDAINWSFRKFPGNIVGYPSEAQIGVWQTVIWIAELGLFVAGGYGSFYWAPEYGAVPRSSILISRDGITWTSAEPDFPLFFNGSYSEPYNILQLSWSPDLGRIISIATSATSDFVVGNIDPVGFWRYRQPLQTETIHVNIEKGVATLVAAGDPVISGHRYGSAWVPGLLQPVPSVINQTWFTMSWNGSIIVVLGPNVCMTSPDGIVWTTRNVPAGNWQASEWNGSLFVALGIGTCMTSPDGINWTVRTCPPGNWTNLAWNGSTFAAVQFTGPGAMTSPDGITWTARTVPGMLDYSWYGMTSNGSSFFVVGGGGLGPGGMVSHDNGVTWGSGTGPSISARAVTWNGSLLVAVGSTTLASYSSNNGSTWNNVATPQGGLNGVAWNGSLFAAVGTNNVITSTDAISWTLRPAVPGTYNKIIWTGGLFVAVGISRVMTSPDGITWTARTNAAYDRRGITWNGTLFVAVSTNNSSSVDIVMTSPDGIVWTNRSAITGDWRAIARGNTVLAAVGTSLVMTSTDGINWTNRTAIAGAWNSIAWNGNLFAAVGPSIAMTSPTGTTWTSRTAVSGTWLSVASSGNRFAAVGSNIAMSSPDGITWTARTAVTGAWKGVAWGNNVFAAVGTNDAMTSPDGINWTNRVAITGDWRAIAWNGSVFAATGLNTLMTSPDGIHWTSRTVDNGNWVSIAWNGSVFAAVSNSGTYATTTNWPDAVTSVSGKVGAVLLNTNDVTENIAGPYYHTRPRVRNNVSNTTPINYDATTGIFSHANSGISALQYGNTSFVPVFTVDTAGHITSVTNTSITISAGAVTSGILAVARGGTGKDATGLANGQILIGNTVNSGFDLVTIAQTAPVIVTNDRGSIRLSHARSGVTAATYGNAISVPVLTIDANGHITGASNVAVSTLPSATANGQLLIGNTVSSGFDITTLTQGSGIVITNDKGAITIAAPATMPTGNGGDLVFYENTLNVTTNYTITTGKSAMSAGPITVNPNVIVTIPSGSRWTVV